jgi:hypothetical protein
VTTFNGNSVKEAVNNTHPLGNPRAVSVKDTLGVAASLRLHWTEYLMEAGEISLFMFCVCSFATLLQHPASPVRHFVISGIARRALMGLAVGATLMALIMSPWGKQSGGHINPAMTFAPPLQCKKETISQYCFHFAKPSGVAVPQRSGRAGDFSKTQQLWIWRLWEAATENHGPLRRLERI